MKIKHINILYAILMIVTILLKIYEFSDTNIIINGVENNKNTIQNIEIQNNIIHIH